MSLHEVVSWERGRPARTVADVLWLRSAATDSGRDARAPGVASRRAAFFRALSRLRERYLLHPNMPNPRTNSRTDARLIVAASDSDPNLLYATRFFAPDPFIFFQHRGKKHLVMNDLELDRARRQATVDEVLALASVEAELKEAEELGSSIPLPFCGICFRKERFTRSWCLRIFRLALPIGFDGWVYAWCRACRLSSRSVKSRARMRFATLPEPSAPPRREWRRPSQ